MPWPTAATEVQQVVTDPRQRKIEAARAALENVESGMLLGLGTGTTAEEFVQLLGAAVADGNLRDIRCVCTSRATEALARSLRIPTMTLEEAESLDITVDGADEMDSRLRLIKGRGGALLREKIVEQASRRFIVIADESKVIEPLGKGPLPIEVVDFAALVLFRKFEKLGLSPAMRMERDQWFTTDEGHRIVDVRVPAGREIAELIDEIRSFAGVVETGFFPTEATEAYIAGDGGVRRYVR
jgi:ribose 5-phosphate isomerase A